MEQTGLYLLGAIYRSHFAYLFIYTLTYLQRHHAGTYFRIWGKEVRFVPETPRAHYIWSTFLFVGHVDILNDLINFWCHDVLYKLR